VDKDSIPRLAASRGAGWITDGVAIFAKRPGAYLQACLLVGLPGSLPWLGVAVGVVMPSFYAGLLAMLKRQDEGGTPTLDQVLDGFRRPGAFLRMLPLILLNIGFALALFLAAAAIAGVTLAPLIQSGQLDASIESNPDVILPYLPRLLGQLAFLLPFAIVFGWLMMLAVPRVALDGVRGLRAFGDAAVALWRNLVPMLVNLICMVLVLVVLVALAFIPLVVVGMLQQAMPALAMLLQVLVMAVLTSVVILVYCATMYRAWREIFGPDAPPVADDQLAA
jgi:hypothetical protein